MTPMDMGISTRRSFSREAVTTMSPIGMTLSRMASDAVVAPSDGFARVLREGWGMRSLPVDVVPTGIDLTRFDGMDGARFRAKHGLAPHERVVLYLGRIGVWDSAESADHAAQADFDLALRSQMNMSVAEHVEYSFHGTPPAPNS